MQLGKSALFASGVFLTGVLGDWLGGELTDFIMRRTGNLRLARNIMVSTRMFLTLLSLAPIMFFDSLSIGRALWIDDDGDCRSNYPCQRDHG